VMDGVFVEVAATLATIVCIVIQYNNLRLTIVYQSI
jgi:hypothetical protein